MALIEDANIESFSGDTNDKDHSNLIKFGLINENEPIMHIPLH